MRTCRLSRHKLSTTVLRHQFRCQSQTRHFASTKLLDSENKSENNLVELRELLSKTSTEHGLESLSDWYEIRIGARELRHIQKNFKTTHKYKTSCSLYELLKIVYPDFEWHAWKFQHHHIPDGFWKDPQNRDSFFEWLGKKIGINNLDDWYVHLNKKVIKEYGGGALLAMFHGSPVNALLATYPNHNWVVWKFATVPHGFWKDSQNRHSFFEWLGKTIGVIKLDDWYAHLNKKIILENGGSGLLDMFNGSAVNALLASYPNHNWVTWKFAIVPNNFWSDPINKHSFFEWLGKKIGVNTLDDWYIHLNSKTILENGGSGLLAMFNGSPVHALLATYPNHNWIIRKFAVVPTNFWKDQQNLNGLMSELSEKFQISTLSDWYRISQQQFNDAKALYVIRRNGGLMKVLQQLYPHYHWEQHRFRDKTKRASQRQMVLTLKSLFPNNGMHIYTLTQCDNTVTYLLPLISTEIIEDYTHPDITIPHSSRPLQLDAFIPSLSLAFEYQGQQHYHQVGIFSSLDHYQFHDTKKQVVCKQNNITLVEVPYWWDRKKQSLMATIVSARPDLQHAILSTQAEASQPLLALWQPIPQNKPKLQQKK